MVMEYIPGQTLQQRLDEQARLAELLKLKIDSEERPRFLQNIRYVLDAQQGGLDFSHDPVTLKAFGKDPAKEPEAWRRFKTSQARMAQCDSTDRTRPGR